MALLNLLDVTRLPLSFVVEAPSPFIFRSARYASKPLIPVEANIQNSLFYKSGESLRKVNVTCKFKSTRVKQAVKK